MSLIRKTTTRAATAANRANSAESTGPASAAGKAQSKMNALKHGKHAARPDPAALMLAGLSLEEEAERLAMRAEMVHRYRPADDFAALQAEELADLQFEVRRLERVQQVLWRREQELLEIELRRRALRQRPHVIEGLDCDTRQTGLAGAPDSPAKFRELLLVLDWIKACCGRRDFAGAKTMLLAAYGSERAEQRARKMWSMLEECQRAGEAGEAERALAHLQTMLADQIADARENLEICELEQGELSAAGQAMHLLAATHSRAWAWVRQQENALRRSLDRKVRCLLELRRQAAREAASGDRDAGVRPGPAAGPPLADAPPANSAGASPAGAPGAGGLPAEAANGPWRNGEPALTARTGRRKPRPQSQDDVAKKIARNRGTKPRCAVESTNRCERTRCAGLRRFYTYNAWGRVTAPVDGRRLGASAAKDARGFMPPYINVPHHLGSGGEVVAALGGHVPLGGGPSSPSLRIVGVGEPTARRLTRSRDGRFHGSVGGTIRGAVSSAPRGCRRLKPSGPRTFPPRAGAR